MGQDLHTSPNIEQHDFVVREKGPGKAIAHIDFDRLLRAVKEQQQLVDRALLQGAQG
jgi:hypothetical protein